MNTTDYSKIAAIKARKSVRTFSSEPLSQEHVSKIKAYLKHTYYEMGPFGHRIEFHYSRVSNNITSKGEKVGTYGVIKNPSAYLISVCNNAKEHLVDLGYIFEKMVIYFQSMGIDSCWLGGAFNRKMFLEKYDVNKNKIVPIILPIGYGRERIRLVENAVRKLIKADDRLPWYRLFFNGRFEQPLTEEETGNYRDVFEMVRRGPSASNKQPWRLLMDQEKHEVHFYLEHTPNYGSGKLDFDIQYVDMGIAMYHFEAAASELGHGIKWDMGREMDLNRLPPHYEYIGTAIISEY